MMLHLLLDRCMSSCGLTHRRGVERREFSTTDPASLKAGNVSCRRQTLPLAGAVCRATALFESSVHSQLPWLSPSSLPYTSVASVPTQTPLTLAACQPLRDEATRCWWPAQNASLQRLKWVQAGELKRHGWLARQCVSSPQCRTVAIHAPASNCGVTRITVLALAEGYQPCVCVAPRGIVEISQ